jgi:type II secretory pathway pseudopilin PulG
MKLASHPPLPAAFTRLEALAVLAVLFLLAAAILPALAGNRVRSDRVLCANNLRQIGMAFQLWGNDHGEQQPWEVLPGDGGTLRHPLSPNVWYHFAWMSNELATPKILFCPTDTGDAARDFTGDPSGGYLHPNFANRATSYFLAHYGLSFLPSYIIAGDRNMSADSSVSCSRFVSSFSAVFSGNLSSLKWNSALHNNAGNALAQDGRVEQWTSAQFRRGMQGVAVEDNSSFHFITPR